MRLVAAIFVAVAMVLVAPTGSEAKTALFGAQGLFDATCPQIGKAVLTSLQALLINSGAISLVSAP